MIRVIFKNLQRSELAEQAAIRRLDALVEKFPDLRESRLQVTLEMQNSPHQAGPDVFTVKLQANGGRYGGLRMEKSASTLYIALADLVGHLLELLNRMGDRQRAKERAEARKTAGLLYRGGY